jgi:signal peptidase I
MPRGRRIAVRAASAALTAAFLVLAASSYSATYVGGDSMSPALVRGDLAIVRRGAAPSSGDVVLVDKAGWPSGVLHRVVSLTFDGRLQLRGDANPIADFAPVPRAAVRGVVVLVVPTGRALAVLEAVARMVQSRVT